MSNPTRKSPFLSLGFLLMGAMALEAADMPAVSALTPDRPGAEGLVSDEGTPPEVPPKPAVEEADTPMGPPMDLDKPGVVNMALKGAPLHTVLEQIVLNGNWDLIIRDVEKDTAVTAFLSGVSVREALDSICDISGLRYKVRGRIIVFTRPEDSGAQDAEAKGQTLTPAPSADSPTN